MFYILGESVLILHVISEDWHIPSGVPTNQVINNFDSILDHASNISTGFIVLEHDLYQQTVDLAIGYILP